MDVRTWKATSRDPCPGEGRAGVGAWAFGFAALLVAVTVLAGVFLVLAPPSYRAEAKILIGARTHGLIGLRAHVAAADRETPSSALTKSQARLVTSRDLARRAIEDLGIDSNPEFDPVARERGTISRALVLLGLERDPGRSSRPERILQAYEERLSVKALPDSRLVTIAFQSEDRDFAARAANRIADLYLEMRAETKDRAYGVPEARIVERAVSPSEPVFPREAFALMVGLSVSALTVISTLYARARSAARRRDAIEDWIEQPQVLGQARVLAHPEASVKPLTPPRLATVATRSAADEARAVAAVAAHILSLRRRTVGTSVLTTSFTTTDQVAGFMLALGRRLAQEARVILMGLDEAQWRDLGLSAAGPTVGVGGELSRPARLADLAAGRASFGEVIRRDPASRLHFLAAEAEADVDRAGSAGIFETLARTYDVVLFAAPSLDRDDLALTLAKAADFVVLAAPLQHDEFALKKAEADLIDRGVREVLIVGLPPRARGRLPAHLRRDAA